MENIVKLLHKGLYIFTGAAQSTGVQVSAAKNKWYLIEFIWGPTDKWHLANNDAQLTLDTP